MFTNSHVVDLKFSKDINNLHMLPVCLNITNTNHKRSNCYLAKVFKLSSQMSQYSIKNYKNIVVLERETVI